MREASTYRAARRNLARANGDLGRWRHGSGHARAANDKAKLPERRRQCAEARAQASLAVSEALVGRSLKLRGTEAIDALRAYWDTQPRTRAVSRILRELGRAA